ncbi:hypothetical protein B5807_01797 [Epicoccum nigrum]|uniref:Uncharacterized protein n=1 Tax=Epicoccum nigrum TaxID=105696 RepID=A0A1Y2MGE8_EPING|nr:hypothetical protein B5807_01797 [Epicoccum nigrum]
MTQRPIPAVGLATALLLLVDFAIKCLQKQNAIYQPGDGAAVPVVENAAVLQRIIDGLFRLQDCVGDAELRKLSEKSRAKLSEPALLMLKISDEARELVPPLIEALVAAQAKGSYGDPRWGTAREALCHHAVWKERDVTGLKKKLRAVRKEVDVALLLALRQYLDQSAETGLPVFSEEGSRVYWETWQNEALDAVHANEWKPKNKKHVDEFSSQQVERLIGAANEAYFCEQVFERLNFEELEHRLNAVATPHRGTLEWVFDDPQTDEGGVLEWLGNQRGENLFWVTGRPGAGKTTLMKSLFRNDRIFDYLEAWSGHAPGITSGFFFWNCGTELQRSGLGMLRSILYESLQDMIYGPLEKEASIIQTLFADRWEQFRSYGGGLDALSYAELRRAFELMISDTTTKFLFLIDGLDEMDEAADLVDIIPLLTTASNKENIKLLVSSRPSPAFQEAFDKRPRLWVDDHTSRDVHAYITDAFGQNEALAKLRGNTVAPEEKDIVEMLTEASSGIFLWAKLATKFLLQELTGNDNFTALQNRAEVLPADLDELLSHILSNLEPADLEQACKISALVEAHGYPPLLGLSFALSSDEKASIAAPRAALKQADMAARYDAMRHMLTYKCRNLFDVFDTAPPPTNPNPAMESIALPALRVTYAHRTIRSFFLSPSTQKAQRLPEGFSAAAAWAAAHLHTLKALTGPSSSSSGTFPLWAPLSRCLEASLLLASATGKAHVTYLSSALDTALALHGVGTAGPAASAAQTQSASAASSTSPRPQTAKSQSRNGSSASSLSASLSSLSPNGNPNSNPSPHSSAGAGGAGKKTTTTTTTTSQQRPVSSYPLPLAEVEVTTDLPSFAGAETQVASALDLAALLNLRDYIGLKAKDADRKTARHALEYSAAMRRRVGLGGESLWLGEPTGPRGLRDSVRPTAVRTTGGDAGAGAAAGDLRLLRAQYAKKRDDVEALMQYYTLAVRWGKKPPALEALEAV